MTLALGGDVPLDQFADTMERFHRLIDLLSREVGGDAEIAWTVEELSAGSAIVTVLGQAQVAETAERIGRAYSAIGRALELEEPIPYSPRIAEAARSITRVLNGKITSIRFEAMSEVATVTSEQPLSQAPAILGAWGAIEGRVETLTSRRYLGFTLYDSLHDRAVSCRLAADQADLVREAWGRRVVVRGWVRRDPASRRPVFIDPVRSIEVLAEVEPGSYRRARGVAPAAPDEGSPEVAIRRLRDA